jgi:hypothetical protein
MTRRKMMKRIIKKIRKEQGQALPVVLILMVIGGLIIAPLLSYMSSGLIVGQTYEAIADELYAADSGIEDGLWEIANNRLGDLFSDQNYDPYNYDETYQYPASHPVVINELGVDVTIENVWVPDINPPADAAEANQLIGAGKLIMTGNVLKDPVEGNKHQVKIYYYEEETDGDLHIDTIGVWIPPGFTYAGECTLETWLDASPGKSYSRAIYDHCSGQAVVWTLSNVKFEDLPNVILENQPKASNFTFKYTTDLENRDPQVIAWMTTSGVSDIPYAWDADIKTYHITSQAGGADGTTVEAYALKTELRELGSAISGDYVAIGNSLMERSRSTIKYRDVLLDYSDATANTIPANGRIEKAFLYWSGWVEGEDEVTTYFEDDCRNMNKWFLDRDWSVDGGNRFEGHHSSGSRYLEMRNSVNLSTCESGTATVSWQQDASRQVDSNDCLKYQFYNETTGWGVFLPAFCGNRPQANFSATIPDEYLTENFKMRFYLDGFNSNNEYAYIDNIRITGKEKGETIADTTVVFKINDEQVYFEDDIYGNPTVPTKGNEEMTADEWQVIDNTNYGQPHGYSYSCLKDVTGLLQEFTTNGNAKYTVADVEATSDARDEWQYAGWSLIIIYASPETRGHQLYLYDTFLYCDHDTNLDFDQDGEPGGTISGFLVPDQIEGELIAATITCFVGEGDDWYEGDYFQFNSTTLDDGTSSLYDVWNGRSVGMTYEGVDVDTFYVTWESELLEPGDSSAQIDIYTEIDIWNLVYIIISFRSDTFTGGTVTYLIRD